MVSSTNHGSCMNVMLEPVIGKAPTPPDVNARERELLEAARVDPEAVAQLYRTHYEAIARYILRRVGDAASAEDLTADVFVKMMNHLPTYRVTDVPFKAWLYRIATNRVNRWIRWRKLRAWVMLGDVPAKPQPEVEDRAKRVRETLLQLPVPFQTVLALHYLEEMSVAEIAKVVGCAEGTVKSRLARGREMMRTQLLTSEGES